MEEKCGRAEEAEAGPGDETNGSGTNGSRLVGIIPMTPHLRGGGTETEEINVEEAGTNAEEDEAEEGAHTAQDTSIVLFYKRFIIFYRKIQVFQIFFH